MIRAKASGESRRARAGAFASVLMGALLLMVVVSGCGSGSGGETSPSAPTKQEFRKQAATICKRSAAKRRAALKAYVARHPNGKASRAQEEEAMTETLLPPIEAAVAELKKLGVPEGDQTARSMILGLEEGLQKVKRNLPAFLDGTLASVFRKAEVAANAEGLPFCSGI